MQANIFITFMLVLGCLFGCNRPETGSGNYSYDVAYSAVTLGHHASSQPSPTPQPKPAEKCENCGGSGWVGDGSSWMACQVCNADKRKPRPPGAPAGSEPETQPIDEGKAPEPLPEPEARSEPPAGITRDDFLSLPEAIAKALEPALRKVKEDVKSEIPEPSVTDADIASLPEAIAKALEPSFTKVMEKLEVKVATQTAVSQPQAAQAVASPPPLKPPAQAVPQPRQKLIDDSPGHWTFPGNDVTPHLINHPIYPQDPAYVATLEYEEKLTLHDWLHEGKWKGYPRQIQASVRSAPMQTPYPQRSVPQRVYRKPIQQQANCPSGNCPNQRQGWFIW